MKVTLNKHMLSAIHIPELSEMDNSGMWSEDMTKKERKNVEKGIEELEKMIENNRDTRFSYSNISNEWIFEDKDFFTCFEHEVSKKTLKMCIKSDFTVCRIPKDNQIKIFFKDIECDENLKE